MNAVNLIGRIGKEIELKYKQDGTAIASFTIAIDQSYKNKSTGQKVEKTSWIDIVAFRGAETINQYFGKGSRIGIQGELEQQTWQDNQGQKKSKIIVKCEKFFFIDGKSNNNKPQYKENKPQVEVMDEPFEVDDESIPF